MTSHNASLPPAVLLGGHTNALSIARSLGRTGVKVYALGRIGAPLQYSRYCTCIPLPGKQDISVWGDYLLGRDSDWLRGAVLLPCNDAELEFVLEHREQLAQKYLLDYADPDVQRSMLNKLRTYEIAAAAGIPLPNYWTPRTRSEVEALQGTLTYPLIVKPLYAHLFRKHFPIKLVVAHDFEQVIKATDSARLAGVEVMLVEMIPGPDDRLCSYYSYLDETGTPLVHFTKRVIRRSPPIYGGGSCHITDWNPEVKELGLRFFQAAGLRGLGNVEFKRDDRDGRLKLIECNVRFTEGTVLVSDSGVDLPLLVYNRLAGRPLPCLAHYRKGLRFWFPSEDFRAFRQLRREGTLTLWQWLASVRRPRVLPFFRWRDPLPTLVAQTGRLRRSLTGGLRSLLRLPLSLFRSPAR